MGVQTIRTLTEMEAFVGDVFSALPQTGRAAVIALSGDLGAGKTAFTQILARKLGITEHVPSPTFMIMRMYETANDRFSTLVHIDAYRVEDAHELEVLNISELFMSPQTLICIEWPERISKLVPDDAVHILLTAREDGSRLVMVK